MVNINLMKELIQIPIILGRSFSVNVKADKDLGEGKSTLKSGGTHGEGRHQ